MAPTARDKWGQNSPPEFHQLRRDWDNPRYVGSTMFSFSNWENQKITKVLGVRTHFKYDWPKCFNDLCLGTMNSPAPPVTGCFKRENPLDSFCWFLSLRHGVPNLCCSFCSLVFQIIIRPSYLGSPVHPLQMNQSVIIVCLGLPHILWSYPVLQSKEPMQCFGYHQHFSKNPTNRNAQKGDGFVNTIGDCFAKNLMCIQFSLPNPENTKGCNPANSAPQTLWRVVW